MKQHKPLKDGQVRDVNDRYETPRRETNIVLRFLKDLGMTGKVLEPACGTGRMVRAIRDFGWECEGRDLEETGDDFLEMRGRWPGPLITNPPYHKGMAFKFVQHALRVADGPVAMLLQGGFLWGEGRSDSLRGPLKPLAVIVIPWRIYFYRRDGQRIQGQAYNNIWVIWPERSKRPYRGKTEILIAE